MWLGSNYVLTVRGKYALTREYTLETYENAQGTVFGVRETDRGHLLFAVDSKDAQYAYKDAFRFLRWLANDTREDDSDLY